MLAADKLQIAEAPKLVYRFIDRLAAQPADGAQAAL
jgi:hypothetical protein